MLQVVSLLRSPVFFQTIRYALVGSLAVIIQIVVLYIWVSVLGLKEWYLVGAVVGFCIALTVAFFLQKYWTFRDHTKETRRRQFVQYSAIAVANLVLNIALLSLAKIFFEYLSLDFFAGWYVLAQLGIFALCALLSFLANRFITFRQSLPQPPPVY